MRRSVAAAVAGAAAPSAQSRAHARLRSLWGGIVRWFLARSGRGVIWSTRSTRTSGSSSSGSDRPLRSTVIEHVAAPARARPAGGERRRRAAPGRAAPRRALIVDAAGGRIDQRVRRQALVRRRADSRSEALRTAASASTAAMPPGRLRALRTIRLFSWSGVRSGLALERERGHARHDRRRHRRSAGAEVARRRRRSRGTATRTRCRERASRRCARRARRRRASRSRPA